jgi:archaellum component FlaF (FlaF/FlaG flagellin family)
MGFKFKSLHISAFAVIVAISIGLAYMLYRRYSNSKEGFENAKTTIVTEEYMSPNKQVENVNQLFTKYGVAPYTDKYNDTNLLDIDLKTFYAFVNKYGRLNNYKNEAGEMLWINEGIDNFFNKIGFKDRGPDAMIPKSLNENFYFQDPTDKKIYILDDDEMAKKIFSQITTNKSRLNKPEANRTSSGMKMSEAGTMSTTPLMNAIPMPMPNNLGAGQDNYNHFNGTSIPTMFYGPNGSIAKISNQGGAFSVIVTDKDGTNIVYDEQNKALLSPTTLAAVDMVIDKVVEVITKVQKASSTSASTNASPIKSDSVMKYYGPNGAVALMYTDSNGNTNLKLVDGTGKEIAYNSANVQSYNPSLDNPNVQQTMGTPTSPNKMNVSSNYNEAYTQSLTSNADYSSSLPKGIPKNMIPPGNEDLYILKSEVVPPVCPACPQPILKCGGGDNKPPPPCPPCARCPEPRFDCKKVPNYGTGNLGANYFGGGGQFGSMPSTSGNFLPYPSVSNYSTFGN